MIASETVRRIAADTVTQYGTRDPFALARAMRMNFIVRDLGDLKGFYKMIYRNPFIFLSRSLSRREARLVCAHELGHHLLHRAAAAVGFEERSLFSPVTREEYEADLFAAELLIPSGRVRECLDLGYTEEQMARAIGADPRLIRLKLSAYAPKCPSCAQNTKKPEIRYSHSAKNVLK